MKKLILILTALILLIGIILFLSFNLQKKETGEVISEYYTHTKAICNVSNYCQDYKIVCDGNILLSIKPLIGATVQHPPEWQDSRNKTSNNICDIMEE